MTPRKAPSAATVRSALAACASYIYDPQAAAPPRANLAEAVRLSAQYLAAAAPGRSVEVRIPPFVAVQCIAGVTHTRGTPPNVVEFTPRSWLRAVVGAGELSAEAVELSGTRAGELAAHLPLFRIADPGVRG